MTTLIQEADSLKLVEKLIRRIVHDLSNPLSAVVGFAELLSYPTVSEEKRERYVHLILEQATRARQIIDTMSQFGDIPDPQVDEIGLNAAVRTAVSLRQTTQRSANIEMVLEMDEDADPVIRADRQYVGRILMNLLLNVEQAFKEQSAKNKRLLVRTTVRGDTAEVLVADNGQGVPEDFRDRIFEAFFTGRKSGGLGLGLHVSQSVARRMGCDLVLLDEVDPEWPGARFLLTLPIVPDK